VSVVLRIAIDVTSVPPQKGGVGFYLAGLIDALQKVDNDNHYVIFADESQCPDFKVDASTFTVVGMSNKRRPTRLLWEQLVLPAMIKKLRIDVLHSPHYTRPLRDLSCASVVVFHDMTFYLLPRHHVFWKKLFFCNIIPLSARKADRIIAVSESTKRDMQEILGISGNKIDVIMHAVSTSYRPDIPQSCIEVVSRKYNLPQEYILFVGTIEPRKNVPRLIEAYRQLVKEEPTAPSLVIVGLRGWHLRDFEKKFREDALVGKIITTGYLVEEDLPAVYAGASLFVYPSLYEGFGIPLLEALACGVPSVTSNVSAMPEVAGDAAIFIDPYDTQSLSSAMLRVLRNDILRQELRQRGIRRAHAFSWEKAAIQTIETYMKSFYDCKRRKH
jgi:glycosyltransferase involved in cell wall biosynthesis